MKHLILLIAMVLTAGYSYSQAKVFNTTPVTVAYTYDQVRIQPVNYMGDSVEVRKKLFSRDHAQSLDTMQRLHIDEYKGMMGKDIDDTTEGDNQVANLNLTIIENE